MESKTVKELKDILRSLNLKVSGNKSVLINRLNDYGYTAPYIGNHTEKKSVKNKMGAASSNPELDYSKTVRQDIKGEDISDFSVEQLRERTRGKRILSVGGCFCPPHAGHYNLVDSAISKIKPDVVRISTTNRNDNPRHGTPLLHTLETWKNWGKILSKKHGVDFYVTQYNGDNLVWGGGAEFIEGFVETDVWEDQMPGEYRKTPLEQKSLEKMSLGFLRGVPRDFDNYYVYHIQREGNLSATAFVKCLKDLEKDCLMYVPDDVKDKKAYIDTIRKNYYNELH